MSVAKHKWFRTWNGINYHISLDITDRVVTARCGLKTERRMFGYIQWLTRPRMNGRCRKCVAAAEETGPSSITNA